MRGSEVIGAILLGLGILLLVACVLALPVMWLWNWLMPDLFGLAEIGFWQALGINLLSGLLFKTTVSANNS